MTHDYLVMNFMAVVRFVCQCQTKCVQKQATNSAEEGTRRLPFCHQIGPSVQVAVRNVILF